MSEEIEYKLRVCIEMLNYTFQETELTSTEVKKLLSPFFDTETMQKATLFLTGNLVSKD